MFFVFYDSALYVLSLFTQNFKIFLYWEASYFEIGFSFVEVDFIREEYRKRQLSTLCQTILQRKFCLTIHGWYPVCLQSEQSVFAHLQWHETCNHKEWTDITYDKSLNDIKLLVKFQVETRLVLRHVLFTQSKNNKNPHLVTCLVY